MSEEFNQNGRSMIEMLGVLAIVGILTVGVIPQFSKAMRQYKVIRYAEEYTLFIRDILIYKRELLKAVPQSTHYSLAEYIERAGLIPQSWKRIGTMIIDSQQNRAHIFVRDTRRLAFDFYLDGNTNRHLKLDICMAMLQKVIRPMHEEIYSAYIYSTAAEDGSAPSYSTGTWYGDSHCGSSSRKCLSHISAPDIIKACTSCIAERTCVLVFDL